MTKALNRRNDGVFMTQFDKQNKSFAIGSKFDTKIVNTTNL